MHHLAFLLFTLLFTPALSAQLSVYLEQGIGISDEVNYQPIGLGVDYQLAQTKGFNLVVGLAYQQTTLDEALLLSPNSNFCGFGSCFPPQNSSVKSDESRLVLPFGVNRTSSRFTYGLQVRPGYRFGSSIQVNNPSDGQTVEARFGENLPISALGSSQVNYRVEKSRFSLQIGTDFRYALNARLSFGLNYRYEGLVNDEVFAFGTSLLSSRFEEVEVYRGETKAHYLAASVRWQL